MFCSNSVYYKEQLLSSFLDMNARFGNTAAAKEILSEVSNTSTSLYGFVIKTFGEADQIDNAVDVFHTMLQDQRVIPNIYTFNVLLNACSTSKSLGYKVFDRATQLIDTLRTNERCVQLQLRPDKVTYNTLLKCLVKSATCKEDASAVAEAILLEMEERNKSDPQIKPSTVTFDYAINVCLLVKDEDRMNSFMNMMDKYNLRADARLCNSVLNHYAQTGTPESAERAESFLSTLKQMGQRDNAVQPNVYTYNMVLNAWGRSNHPEYVSRMSKIYESMLSDQIEPDEVTYRTMISRFVKSPNSIGMADKLLLELENDENGKKGRSLPICNLYTMVIQAYLRSRDAERATELLFRWLNTISDNGTASKKRGSVLDSMTPMYHQLVELWILLGDLERATEVAEKLYDMHLKQNNKNTEAPSIQTYFLLHKLWNQSTNQSKDKYLAKIIERIDSYPQY
jgi:hypothetical protein